MYIKDKIPNWQLYTANSSLYDIAKTVFQPLMLREHFRCVPDIIGFSNMLSYDYKIKPLRDTSDCRLLPAVVNYRTMGIREQKINQIEAKTITAALMACLEMPEYRGKTFGVISLLGDQQAKYVQKLLFEKIGADCFWRRDVFFVETHRISREMNVMLSFCLWSIAMMAMVGYV